MRITDTVNQVSNSESLTTKVNEFKAVIVLSKTNCKLTHSIHTA